MAALLLTGLGGEGDDNKDLFSALFCLAVLFQAKMMKNVCNSQTNCVRCYLFRTPSPFFVPSDSLEKRTVCKNISFTPKHSNSRLIPKWSKVYSTIQAPGITMIQKRSKVVWAASAFSAASRQGRRADRAQTSRLRPRCQRQQPLGRAGRQ